MNLRAKVNNYDKCAEKRHEEIVNGTKKAIRFVERPMMISMIPNIKNKKVLMLGCGTGEEKLILEKYFPQKMVGIDISQKSIEIARANYQDCEFYVGDMLKLPFPKEEFDFVYSSLAISHIKDKDRVFKEVFRVLKKNGEFLFSVGHPLRFSSQSIKYKNNNYRTIGFSEENSKVLGSYMSPTKQINHFHVEGTLEEFIAPPSYFFENLINNNFMIENFKESRCTDECKKIDKDYYIRYHEIPQFMAFLAKKQAN